jgi:hypothetical protein
LGYILGNILTISVGHPDLVEVLKDVAEHELAVMELLIDIQ